MKWTSSDKTAFLIKTEKKNYFYNLIISLAIASTLAFITYFKNNEISSLLFNFLLFFIVTFRATEYLITKKCIYWPLVIYGKIEKDREAKITFIFYVAFLIGATILLYY